MILFLGCSGAKTTVAPPPPWTVESPVTPGYYIGIGSASKLAHPLDADAVAKQHALDNLSREIRVKVDATSDMNVLQVNGWLNESFTQQSQSTTQEDLEGFELVDTYANETEVLVYYRLSKAKHAQIKAAKRQAAIELADGQLQAANRARMQGQVQQAVDASIRGMDALRPFLDQPLIMPDENGENRDVALALMQVLNACMTEVTLSCEREEVQLTVDEAFRGEAVISATLNGIPAPNLPLNYKYSRGDLPTRGETVTDGQGRALIILEKFEPGTTESLLEIAVNGTALAQNLPLTHPFRATAQSMQSAPLRVPVKLEPVQLQLKVEERAFGKKRDREVLNPAIRQALQTSNVRLTEDCDPCMTMVLEADARPGGQGQGFTTVYVDLVGTVTDDQGEVIFTQTLTKIKGIQMDAMRATDAAYDKAAEEIQDTFMPALIRLWHGF